MTRYFLALTCIEGVGPAAAAKVLAAYPDAQGAFGAGQAKLAALGLTERQARAVASFKDFEKVDLILEQARIAGQRVVTLIQEEYPKALLTLPAPPLAIYIKGEWKPALDLAACVVGTRHPTSYGEKVAQHLGAALAKVGICTVSGGARGIDACAHRGALAAGGATVAVLGCGLDVPYPAEHGELFEQIVATGGVLLSELPPGTRPDRGTFPARNRLLAALGRACVVVEAGEKSGALITARYAMEQGKTVLAAPGRIDQAQSRGANRLIRDGAKPLLEMLDVMEEVLGEHVRRGQAEDETAARRQTTLSFDEIAAPDESMNEIIPPPPVRRAPEGAAGQIWTALVAGATDTDAIVQNTGLSAAQVNAALLEMELSGLVSRRPGNVIIPNLED